MTQYYARQATNKLEEAVDALWDSPEDLHLIRRELLRRKTMGATILRTMIEARLADLGGSEPHAAAVEERHDGTTPDVAALKRQISNLTIEVTQLRRMAGFSGTKAYLYARVGAHEGIEDYALEALREAHRIRLEAKARDAKDDNAILVSRALSRYIEDAFDEIARLRSEHR